MFEDRPQTSDSLTKSYAQRLGNIERSTWRRYLFVQQPYRWNLRRVAIGRTLEIGCGAGRNLRHLQDRAVGIDANPWCVEEARSLGFAAYSPEEFDSSFPGVTFDCLLFSHVLEHCTQTEGHALVTAYLPRLRAGGHIVFETPQEAGFRSDSTHVTFVTDRTLTQLCSVLRLEVTRSYSFPFPRWAGFAFPYNEFVVVARKP